MAFDINKAAGEGMGDFDRSILGMPFISIIQKGSPQFDETHKEFATKGIKDCKPGMIFFQPENRILRQPLEVIPLAQRTLYTEWKPRKGGFVGNRDITIVDHPNYRKGALGSKDENREYLGENELARTIFYAVLFKDGEEWKKGMFSFTSTGLKPARQWGKQIFNVRFEGHPDLQPPVYSAIWNVGTKAEQNDEGGWFNWDIKIAKVLNPEADEILLTLGQDTRVEAERKMLPSSGGGMKRIGSSSTSDTEDQSY